VIVTDQVRFLNIYPPTPKETKKIGASRVMKAFDLLAHAIPASKPFLLFIHFHLFWMTLEYQLST